MKAILAVVLAAGSAAAQNDPISDLAASPAGDTSVTLSWTAPTDWTNFDEYGFVDPASKYDIRMSTGGPITEANWTSAVQVLPGLVPAQPGIAEACLVTGLTANQPVWFAVKWITLWYESAWSPISNNAAASMDSISPSAVSDLAIVSTGTGSATLTWEAPGDEGSSGTAAVYDLRCASMPITSEAAFQAATRIVAGVSVPAAPGTLETMSVDVPGGGRALYFAVRAGDERPNWGPLSNSPGAFIPGSTEAPPAAAKCAHSGTASAAGPLAVLVIVLAGRRLIS